MDDLKEYWQAKQDIVDQIEDLIKKNQNLGEYSKWLNAILEHIKSLRRKDFF